MVFDFSIPGPAENYYLHGRCLLNGEELREVYYIDTESCTVRTYDLTGHPQCPEGLTAVPHLAGDWLNPPADIKVSDSGVLYWERRGNVDLYTKGGEKYDPAWNHSERVSPGAEHA